MYSSHLSNEIDAFNNVRCQQVHYDCRSDLSKRNISNIRQNISRTSHHAAYARSQQTRSRYATTVAVLRPRSLNVGSRTAAANAPSAVYASGPTSCSKADYIVRWINIGWHHRYVPECTSFGELLVLCTIVYLLNVILGRHAVPSNPSSASSHLRTNLRVLDLLNSRSPMRRFALWHSCKAWSYQH